MKKSKLLLGGALGLTAFTLIGTPLTTFASQVENSSYSQSVRSVRPDSFTVKFVNPNNGEVTTKTLRGYFGMYAPKKFFNGKVCTWKSNCGNLTLNANEYLSAQTLELDATWTEKNPTIVFGHVVRPESFNVRFVDQDGKLIKEQKLSGYKGMKAPRVIVDGELCKWKADFSDLTLDGKDFTFNNNDYLSAQTLELDYTWIVKNPTITFTATSIFE